MKRKALYSGFGAAVVAAAVVLGSGMALAAPTTPPSTPDSSTPSSSSPDTSAPASSTPDSSAPASTVPAAAPTTVTLPLAVPLTVTINTGPGGALTDVTVDPADGLVATKVRPRQVVFSNETTGVRVTVNSRGNTQSISARAGSLADISGTGGWSGDVFGNGTITTVSFTVGDRGDGTPDITGVSSSDATAVIGATSYRSDDDDDEESSARATINFTNGAMSRTLTISASVHNESDDDSGSARVRITLGKLRGLPQDAAVAAGPKVWTGLLCNGSTGTINYTVNADGTLSNVSSTPAAQRSEVRGGEAEVRFSGDERVRIRVRMSNGQITVNVDERIRCENAPNPSVNVPTSIGGGDDDGDDDHSGSHGGGSDDDDDDDHGDDHGGNGHGGDDDDDNEDD